MPASGRTASYGNQEIAEYVGSGTVSLTRRFVYATGVDEPIVSVSAAGACAYHFQDALGSVVALANASGLVTEKYAYTAYGRTVTLGTPTAAYRYTGRRYDEETGLYFYRARAYSAILGRFLQTDPIGTKGGINLYAYTMNDPVNRVDPTGNASEYSIGGQRYGREYQIGLSQYSYGMATTSPYRITDDHINQSSFLEDTALTIGTFGAGYAFGASRAALSSEYRYTQTLLNDIASGSRPYQTSTLLINEIIAGGNAVADRYIPGALRYEAEGSLSGFYANRGADAASFSSTGTYELVIHPRTNTISHFCFVGGC